MGEYVSSLSTTGYGRKQSNDIAVGQRGRHVFEEGDVAAVNKNIDEIFQFSGWGKHLTAQLRVTVAKLGKQFPRSFFLPARQAPSLCR